MAWWNKKQNNNIPEEKPVVKTDTVETNSSVNSAYINLMSQRTDYTAPYDSQDIIRMAADPMNNIEALRKWSKWAYYANGVVSTAIDSIVSLHTLDYIVTAKQKKAGAERGGYKASMDKMNSVLRSMRYKEIIRDIIFHEANEGMYIGYMETRGQEIDKRSMLSDADILNITEINSAGVNVVVTSLPLEYTRIIGRRNNCYEVAFDLRYFNSLPEPERKRALQGFPKQIREGWEKYTASEFGAGETWLRLDWKRTIVVKIKSGISDPYGVPFAVAALDDIDYANYFINTKRYVLDSVNNQIYYETFPEGEKKGASALTTSQQAEQHNVVKQALTQRRNASGTAFFSLAAGTTMDYLPVDISILDEENEDSISEDVNEDLGFSAAALSGSSTGNYATATLNLNIVASKVFAWIEDIVDELNKCLSYNVIRDSNYKVEFRVLPVTFANRDSQVQYLSDLYARGKGSLLAWVAATGMNADDYLSLMDYELAEDFENKYPVHKTSYTLTGDGDSGGETSGEETSGTLKEDAPASTVSTVENGGNSYPAPSD